VQDLNELLEKIAVPFPVQFSPDYSRNLILTVAGTV
jgi:hypothetical protein